MRQKLELKLLNNNQEKEAKNLLKSYKFVYICNSCGSCYGTDNKEKYKRCPVCESKLLRKKKVKN